MGLRFSGQKYGSCFFVTTTFRNWKNYGYICGVYEKLTETLGLYVDKYKCQLIGYVFMPSHIHLLLGIDGLSLANFMRDYKKFITQKSFKDLGIQEKNIWMPRYDKVAIISRKILLQKLEYIHYNPVKAKLVDSPSQWYWSSAYAYESENKDRQPKVCTDWV